MVTENVSLGLTYNYIDLGDYDTSYTVNENYFLFFNVFGEIDTNTSVNMHVVKATLNYNF
jgi:opacity protein-like surface antigen